MNSTISFKILLVNYSVPGLAMAQILMNANLCLDPEETD